MKKKIVSILVIMLLIVTSAPSLLGIVNSNNNQIVEKSDKSNILEMIKKKLESVLGKGAVNEVVTMTFNEMGMQMGMMKHADWMRFLEKVINDHISRLASDLIAEECRRTWIPEIEMKLRSFV